MIPLTRLNHQGLILNADLIKCIEQPHDTVVTLINGEKLTVEEKPDEILRRIGEYRRELAAQPLGGRPVIIMPNRSGGQRGS
ncbi:MAG TPA: flagellar FlbD family protein [Terriglobales bacterium]|nr:flagellar FlbD family protein [Terriglobales bacterium]